MLSGLGRRLLHYSRPLARREPKYPGNLPVKTQGTSKKAGKPGEVSDGTPGMESYGPFCSTPEPVLFSLKGPFAEEFDWARYDAALELGDRSINRKDRYYTGAGLRVRADQLSGLFEVYSGPIRGQLGDAFIDGNLKRIEAWRDSAASKEISVLKEACQGLDALLVPARGVALAVEQEKRRASAGPSVERVPPPEETPRTKKRHIKTKPRPPKLVL